MVHVLVFGEKIFLLLYTSGESSYLKPFGNLHFAQLPKWQLLCVCQ